MAGIATGWSVYVTPHAAMVRVRRSLVMRVTVNAGENLVIAGVGMTIAATRPSPGMGAGVDWKLVMRERGAGPRCSRMTGSAGSREARGYVIRVTHRLELRFVAGIAVSRGPGKNSPNVTTGAGHIHVSAGQRECRRIVIERCRRPRGCCVAYFALLREACGHVVRVRRCIEDRQMAGGASRAQCGELAVRVALRTRQRHVRAGQREFCFRVIEDPALPTRSGMANRTIRREARGSVVRRCRLIERIHVARRALRRGAGKLVVHVALRARHGNMRAGQRKSRSRVIEPCV